MFQTTNQMFIGDVTLKIGIYWDMNGVPSE